MNIINKLKINNKGLNLLEKSIDLIIILIVISFLIYDFWSILFSVIENISKLGLNNEFVVYMADSSKNIDTYNTNVQVIHTDGSWSNGIRSLFIYGTGALRISLLKAGGTPSSRAFVIASTIGADAISKVLNNTINDPKYVVSHIKNWRTLWDGKNETAHVYVEGDKETNTLVETISKYSGNVSLSTEPNINSNSTLNNKFISDGNGMDDLANKIISYIMDILRPILEPVKVNYSNELLANQLNDVSILLFILSIFLFILLLAFMLNILIYINSLRIINYFTNKYIKMYVNFNKKIIGLELFFLGSSILYFMYILSYALHFLATHPITFT